MTGVTIVDFDAGNMLSVARAFEHLDVVPTFARRPDDVLSAAHLVLPGVGAFGDCAKGLRDRALFEPVKAYAASGRPMLGICVGFQMMFDVGEEFGVHAGLGIISGRVRPIPPIGTDGRPHKIPHIGWNAIRPHGMTWRGTILENIPPETDVYFVHSFAAVPEKDSDTLAVCDYDGLTITAAARRGNVVGCQFHPEKSGAAGLSIIETFLRL